MTHKMCMYGMLDNLHLCVWVCVCVRACVLVCLCVCMCAQAPIKPVSYLHSKYWHCLEVKVVVGTYVYNIQKVEANVRIYKKLMMGRS